MMELGMMEVVDDGARDDGARMMELGMIELVDDGARDDGGVGDIAGR